ncbi:MAG: Nif11-like leader peptide family natural product precursor [Phormidesmis sp.]
MPEKNLDQNLDKKTESNLEKEPKKNAARLYKNVTEAQASQQRQKALGDPETFVKLAAAQGHAFAPNELTTQLNQLSDEEIAAIFNPGIPPRRHLFPR